MMTQQATINNNFPLYGVNVLNGKPARAEFYPREPGHGLSFIIGAGTDQEEVPVTLDTVTQGPVKWKGIPLASTMILNGEDNTLAKIEHIAAAVRLAGIDNIAIAVNDNTVPRFDGSIAGVYQLLREKRQEQEVPRERFTITEDVPYQWAGKPDRLDIYAFEGTVVNVVVDYPFIGRRVYEANLETRPPQELVRARAPAILPKWATIGMFMTLRVHHGVNQENTNILESRKDYCGRPQAHEFVTHKCLDAIGALAVTGKHYQDMHFHFRTTGHRFDLEALRVLQGRLHVVGEEEQPTGPEHTEHAYLR